MGRLKGLKPFVKVYIGLIAAFFLSMVLVYCIPTSWIQGHVESSLEVMESEGERPVYAFYRHSAIVDNHTDMLMYQGTIPNKPEYNVVQRAMSVNQYPRYWHGYMVWLRPLTVIFQVQELRYLGMIGFYLLFFWSAWLIGQKTNFKNALFYVLTIASAYLVAVTTCFQYLDTFYILFVSLIAMLSRNRREKPMNLMLFFFVIGMVENFFDFLTYPILTLGIPMILLLWMRVQDDKADFKDNTCFMVKGSAAWGLGYALCWMAKWALMVLVLGMKTWEQTMGVMEFRLEGSEEDPLDRWGTIRRNLKAWLNVQDNGVISWSKIVLVILIVAVILMIVRKCKDLKTISAYVPMLFVAAYPYLWYLVMSNHSQIHFWYTYRAQLVTLFGILMFLSCILREKQE